MLVQVADDLIIKADLIQVITINKYNFTAEITYNLHGRVRVHIAKFNNKFELEDYISNLMKTINNCNGGQ